MTDLSLAERLKIRSLAVERTRRRALTVTLSSPLLRWRFSGGGEQILIVPQDLRAADPSFWFEVENGHFGLATEIADLKGTSPFRVDPPSRAWERELHGFSWLRHLAAAENEQSAIAARQFVLDWVALHRNGRGVAYEPAIIARRLMSWIAQANLLLEGADARSYTTILGSITQQVVALKTTWRNAPHGVPRLVCLIALVLADLAISGHDRQLQDAQAALVDELNLQILDDGGHISRNPSVLAEIVLDLLPLGQCFQARGREAPEEIPSFVKKALAFLRFMRLGDGMLARFNGVSTGSPAALATVLGYSGGDLEAVSAAPNSGYARLERGDVIAIVDVGSPPPLEMSTEAQAGALSFELTSRARLILANGGFPGSAHRDWDSAARATASHNTLCLAESSSARLVRHPQLEAIVGGLPIRGPDFVAARLSDEGGIAVLAASHDGYAKRFGLMHNRRLSLSADGKTFEGLDRLETTEGRQRLKSALPFSIHFHIHPDCKCERGPKPDTCRIKVQDGQVWSFKAEGVSVSIEDGLYFVDSTGPRPSAQIVLRGATTGDIEVRWKLVCEPAL
ncbi:MAG: heparinase II/III family protein [Hyphomicrobium sp.]